MIISENTKKILAKKAIALARSNGKFPSISFDNGSQIDSRDLSAKLESISETESFNDEKLFWFSYDEDLKAFPNGVKLEKLKFPLTHPSQPNEEKKEDKELVFSRKRKPKIYSKKRSLDIDEKKDNSNNEESEFNSESSEEKTNAAGSNV